MVNDNVTEDRMPATARLARAWPPSGEMVEVLEVREFVPAGSMRLGEMLITVKGGEPMTLSIAPTHPTF